ncbi:MAG: helix-turn-helix domain-containing protein [Acidobacteriota bacterium]|nr:helix-turn-helix domain-containing protein [Acidobacteriota bacterium]
MAQKLRHVRTVMGLSQNEMIGRLGLTGKLMREEVSDFERNRRIPSLDVILGYARAANVTVEALIDDELTLPNKLPCKVRHEGTPRRSAAKKSRKRQCAC